MFLKKVDKGEKLTVWPRLAKLAIAIALVCILWGCGSSDTTWKIYQNKRYSFEFPYPSNWVAALMPTNGDGQAFTPPKNPNVEIRGWAGFIVNSKNVRNGNPKISQENFTTRQGLTGELQVEVEANISMMTLMLKKGVIIYNWQGRSPSKEFADYYRFFYYIASQYRILPANYP